VVNPLLMLLHALHVATKMHVYTSYDSRLNSTKKFSFVRGGEPLGFVIGQNHMHYLWEACDATDAECQEADLFEKVYHSNQTSAALGALGHIRSWGFNGVGYDNGGFTPADDEAGRVIMANGPFYVLTEITKTSSWMPSITYPDPWDPATASHIGASITRQCIHVRPYRQNVLGYIWTDIPDWNIAKAQQQKGQDWVSTLRCLNATAPGQQRYKEFLRQQYCNHTSCHPSAVCQQYELPSALCPSWEALDLCSANNTRVEAVMVDDYKFLPQIAAEVYSVANNSIKACDPEAVVFTDTFSVSTPDSIIRQASRFADALSIQPDGAPFNVSDGILDHFHLVSGGLPMLIADYGFAYPHPPYEKQEWEMFPSERAAGAAYSASIISAAQSGFVIGFNKCGYIDRAIIQPTPVLKPGTLNFDGSSHEPLASLITEANHKARGVWWEVSNR